MFLQTIGEWIIKIYIANAQIWAAVVVRMLNDIGGYIPSPRKIDEAANESFNRSCEKWLGILLMVCSPAAGLWFWSSSLMHVYLAIFLLGPITLIVVCTVILAIKMVICDAMLSIRP